MNRNFSKILVPLLIAFLFIQTALAMDLLVPAYFYPDANWDKLTIAARRVGIVAIANPHNGPDTTRKADYTKAITNLRNAGGRVIGYVSTNYTKRPSTKVKVDIDRWMLFYPNINGIFFDEMSSGKNLANKDSIQAHINYYRDLTSYVKTKYAGRDLIVANPGTSFLEAYLTSNCADCFVIFESCTGFDSWRSDSWVKSRPKKRFAVLPYSICKPETMNATVDRAFNERAGFVYVTDDSGCNPWDTLPTYWDALVSKVASK